MIFTYNRKIFGYECDIYGHLNNACYQHLLEEARSDALDKMQLSLEKLRAENVSIYLRKIEIEYLKGIAFGSVVMINTTIQKFSRLKSVWLQEICGTDGTVYCRAIVEGVFAQNGKPYRIPVELEQKFLPYTSKD